MDLGFSQKRETLAIELVVDNGFKTPVAFSMRMLQIYYISDGGLSLVN